MQDVHEVIGKLVKLDEVQVVAGNRPDVLIINVAFEISPSEGQVAVTSPVVLISGLACASAGGVVVVVAIRWWMLRFRQFRARVPLPLIVFGFPSVPLSGVVPTTHIRIDSPVSPVSGATALVWTFGINIIAEDPAIVVIGDEAPITAVTTDRLALVLL